MSIHPSLKYSLKNRKQRTVLKRIERVKQLMEKDLWKDDVLFHLPKTKLVRIKIKKIAKEEAPLGQGATPSEAAVSSTAQPATKSQAKPSSKSEK